MAGATEHEKVGPSRDGKGAVEATCRVSLPNGRDSDFAFSQKLPMPPGAAPLSMKIIPLRWRGVGVVVPNRKTHPEG